MIFYNLMYLAYLFTVGSICVGLGRRIEKRFGLKTLIGSILVFGIFLGTGMVIGWFFDSIDRVTSNIELPVVLSLWILVIALGIYGSIINNRSYLKGFLLGLFLGPFGAILSLTSMPKIKCKNCGKNLRDDFQVCPYCMEEITQPIASNPTRPSRREKRKNHYH